MWLFGGVEWNSPTRACKPCSVANPTTDTVKIDAELLKGQEPLTAALTNPDQVWATHVPSDVVREFEEKQQQQQQLHQKEQQLWKQQQQHQPQPQQPEHQQQQLLEQLQPKNPRQQSLKQQLLLSRQQSHEPQENSNDSDSELVSHHEQGCSSKDGGLGISGGAVSAVGAALGWLGLADLALEYPYEDLAQATGGFSADARLGAGGAGAVYKGKLGGKTDVAIKVLMDMGGVEGFEDEVRMLSRFKHKNLVTLMGFGQRKGEKYLVYELMPGGDVEGKLKKSRAWLEHVQKMQQSQQLPAPPFPWQQRLHVALGSAVGLAHMVSSTPKTFHRDIKPANILLDSDGTPKMADFGLCAVVKDMDKVTVDQIAGTPGYTCLSYLDSRHVTEDSEVYSFGVVLMELLINKPPALCSQQGDMIFPLLDAVQPYVPGAHGRVMQNLDRSAGWPLNVVEEFADLALSCLDPVPERRPSFAAVVRCLQKLLTMKPLRASAAEPGGGQQRPEPNAAIASESSAGSAEGDTSGGGGWMSWWR